jgi:hypothetical protein
MEMSKVDLVITMLSVHATTPRRVAEFMEIEDSVVKNIERPWKEYNSAQQSWENRYIYAILCT